jgi:hypothetical protein
LAGLGEGSQARVYDVAPTVLRYFDVPTGLALQLGRGAAGLPERASESEREEAEMIRQRLVDLGYF